MSIRGDRAAATAAPAGPPAQHTDDPGRARRPWWIWAAPFAVLLTVLFARNRFLFTAKFYEQGDAAANSIRIQQAMHFTLLIGNYSREGFSPPGPAYMYVVMYGVFLVAAASVAAGHARDLWIFALTGWFLIHGHACFLFIVPVITAAVIAVLAWAHRRTPLASLRHFIRHQRGAWIPAVAISALFVLPIAVSQALPARAGTALATAGALAALAVFALVPGMRTSTEDTDSGLPHAVAVRAARSPGREIVLSIQHAAWIDTTGFFVQAERAHVRACLDEPYWTFMMTRQFICTPQQAAGGLRYTFDSPQAPSSTPVLLHFGHTDVVAGPVNRS